LNEGTLAAIASIQTIFITDIRDVKVVINTGWAMIAMMIHMIFINFIVISTHIVRQKWIKKTKKTQTISQSSITEYPIKEGGTNVSRNRTINVSRIVLRREGDINHF
jgi:hypothetical protein